MSFQLSPGVKVKEIDLTTVVPAVATSEAAIAGVFRWGPVEQPTLVSDENQLIARYGRPTNLNAETFFSAASFLIYSNALYVNRATGIRGLALEASVDASTVSNTAVVVTGLLNDVRTGDRLSTGAIDELITDVAFDNVEETTTLTLETAVTLDALDPVQIYSTGVALNAIANTGPAFIQAQVVKNRDHFETKEGTFDTDVQFVAKYPGKMGNSLRISACYSDAQFESEVALTAPVTFTVGSNTAVVANTDIGGFSVGDIVVVGDSTLGTMQLKITEVDAVAELLHFEDRYFLPADFTATDSLTRRWEFSDLVDTAPGISQYQRDKGNLVTDEMHVVVVDEAGEFSGTPGTILEVFQGLSRATDGKTTDGAANYYQTALNNGSQFVWAVNDFANANTAAALTAPAGNLYEGVFNSGSDTDSESTIAAGAVMHAYNFFASAEDVDVSLVIAGKANSATHVNYLIDNIAMRRKDCIVFASPPRNLVVDNVTGAVDQAVVGFRNQLRSTSYAVLDSGYKYMYDKYNDVYRWVPLNGDIAGLCAHTDNERDAWWSPAGFNRGHIRNIVKLAWNPKQAQRDLLYKNGVNPIVNFPGQGIVMYGDKTLLAKPSAFDRINVRRLFIVLEKAIATAAKFTMFEFNDEFTRATFVNLVTPFLRTVQARRGLYDFRVICDETNNTGEVIDRNEFIGDIYIKPARSINFITLNFVAVRSGVEFEEIIGQF